ncbi:MAG: hypothetical protein ACK5CE_22870 [Actinomycetes bacterium]
MNAGGLFGAHTNPCAGEFNCGVAGHVLINIHEFQGEYEIKPPPGEFDTITRQYSCWL